ncbi:MAG: hypothetical protein MZU84_02325 [Sphingobacterium sp.]|nr:hypothetical protein [Sphingobacterium sp.]
MDIRNQVSESDEANNAAAWSQPVAVRLNLPRATLSSNGWTAPRQGGTCEPVTITNSGTGPDLEYDVSDDADWLSRIRIPRFDPGRVHMVSALPNDGSSIRTGTVTIAAESPLGTAVVNSTTTFTVTQAIQRDFGLAGRHQQRRDRQSGGRAADRHGLGRTRTGAAGLLSISGPASMRNAWSPRSAAFADANGGGFSVNQTDILSIGLNWEKTHAAAASESRLNSPKPTPRRY